MKIAILISIVLFSLDACSSSTSKTEANLPVENAAIKTESCSKVDGKWSVYRAARGKGKEFCGKYPCGNGSGTLELSCSNDRIVGKQLLGINSSAKPLQENWAEIRSELAGDTVIISFNNGECEITYKIIELQPNQLLGEISSKNCKVVNKDVSYDGDALFLRQN